MQYTIDASTQLMSFFSESIFPVINTDEMMESMNYAVLLHQHTAASSKV